MTTPECPKHINNLKKFTLVLCSLLLMSGLVANRASAETLVLDPGAEIVYRHIIASSSQIVTLPSVVVVSQISKALSPSKDEVRQKIEDISNEMGYKYPNVIIKIAIGESQLNPNVRDGDMGIVCPKGVNKGEPTRARGVVQITECWHPEITDAQAYDLDFAIHWAIGRVMAGKCKQEFSTCPL